MTQVGVKPPTFVVFVNDKELMHFSYVRYLKTASAMPSDLKVHPLGSFIRERVERKTEMERIVCLLIVCVRADPDRLFCREISS